MDWYGACLESEVKKAVRTTGLLKYVRDITGECVIFSTETEFIKTDKEINVEGYTDWEPKKRSVPVDVHSQFQVRDNTKTEEYRRKQDVNKKSYLHGPKFRYSA
jgi:hypothetical protein